jgi:hypothetical protein
MGCQTLMKLDGIGMSKYAMIEGSGPYLHWQSMALGRISAVASYIINLRRHLSGRCKI